MPPKTAHKTGVDDYLAAGRTVEDLLRLARPFDPADFATVRMSRDERLRAGVEDLRHRWHRHEWRTQGDYTARSILRVLIRAAEKRGKPTRDGIRVTMAGRALALEAAVSTRAPTRAIPRLEALGFLRRDTERRKPDQAGAFILLTEGAQKCPHNGKGTAPRRQRRGENTFSVVPSDRGGDTSARLGAESVPELRWPTVLAYRERDNRGRWERKYEYLARLGKKRGAIVEYLVAAGGVSTVADLMEHFAGPQTRPRDFKRRTLAMLTGPPAVIVIEGDVVSLGGKWQAALEHARELAGEQETARLQAQKYARQKEAFRRRGEITPDPVPDMRPIPDLRKPWPVHPNGCACPTCEEKLGRVMGEHVEGCNCAPCFTARKEEERKKRVVSLPRRMSSRDDNSRRPETEQVPAAVVEMHRTAPEREPASRVASWSPPEGWQEHPLSCDCYWCVTPEPSYARPWGAS
jgi:hypothetical protein